MWMYWGSGEQDRSNLGWLVEAHKQLQQTCSAQLKIATQRQLIVINMVQSFYVSDADCKSIWSLAGDHEILMFNVSEDHLREVCECGCVFVDHHHLLIFDQIQSHLQILSEHWAWDLLEMLIWRHWRLRNVDPATTLITDLCMTYCHISTLTEHHLLSSQYFDEKLEKYFKHSLTLHTEPTWFSLF